MKQTIAAVIPARSGSQRVKNKNIRILDGHPLIAYTICFAKQIGIFENIYCTTDSLLIGEIADWYGCKDVIYRPATISTSTSPDIEWIQHLLSQTSFNYDYFSILRITSPIKSNTSIASAFDLIQTERADSIRAVTKVREHPGKMWTFSSKASYEISPLLNTQPQNGVAWHARQYQDLPDVYVQTSSFEIIKTDTILRHKTREGKKVLGFPIDYPETLTVDYEDEFRELELLSQNDLLALPKITIEPFRMPAGEM
jgi:CMP-N,N'-diacetyllegionaminic acid synthase